jgi:hypothetical protein
MKVNSNHQPEKSIFSKGKYHKVLRNSTKVLHHTNPNTLSATRSITDHEVRAFDFPLELMMCGQGRRRTPRKSAILRNVAKTKKNAFFI